MLGFTGPGTHRDRVSRPAPSRRTGTRQDHPHCLRTQHSRGHACRSRTALAISRSATDLDQLRWTDQLAWHRMAPCDCRRRPAAPDRTASAGPRRGMRHRLVEHRYGPGVSPHHCGRRRSGPRRHQRRSGERRAGRCVADRVRFSVTDSGRPRRSRGVRPSEDRGDRSCHASLGASSIRRPGGLRRGGGSPDTYRLLALLPTAPVRATRVPRMPGRFGQTTPGP
jgi:hypothetical protein